MDTTTTAAPIQATIQVTAMCQHCAGTVTRSGDPHPWYHVATGREVCAA